MMSRENRVQGPYVTLSLAASIDGGAHSLSGRVAAARYVTIALFATMSGLTAKAVQAKIYTGAWIEGREYRRGPDARIYIDVQGYEKWVEGGRGKG